MGMRYIQVETYFCVKTVCSILQEQAAILTCRLNKNIFANCSVKRFGRIFQDNCRFCTGYTDRILYFHITN